MTLSEIIKQIEVVASKQPSINMIVRNDVYRLNEKADARYGVFAWLQGQHSTSIDSSLISYSFTFFYVDRLKNDLSNQIEIQSVGMQTLDNIIRLLGERGLYIDSYTFNTFNQRFNDECAGVFASVTLQAEANGNCAEAFADYNDDYNDDFMIF